MTCFAQRDDAGECANFEPTSHESLRASTLPFGPLSRYHREKDMAKPAGDCGPCGDAPTTDV